jgi:hypothetical protein
MGEVSATSRHGSDHGDREGSRKVSAKRDLRRVAVSVMAAISGHSSWRETPRSHQIVSALTIQPVGCGGRTSSLLWTGYRG